MVNTDSDNLILDFENISNNIKKLTYFQEIIGNILDGVMILNKNMKIIFINKVLRDLLRLEDLNVISGKSFGDVLECINSEEKEGCGFTKYCSNCEILRAITEGLNGNFGLGGERIIQKYSRREINFFVSAGSFNLNGAFFVLCILKDKTSETRKKILENIFFHDILNTATSIKGLSELLVDMPPKDFAEIPTILADTSNRLIDEIISQRDLLHAENDELKINTENIDSDQLLNEITASFNKQNIAKEKNIEINKNSEKIVFVSDNVLLCRAIGNLLKNALEATPAGAIITLSARKVNNEIEFFVHNPGYISMDIQGRLLKRTFSSKGLDRGLGLYSAKLLTEKYLKGKIYFESKHEEGTTFFIRLPLDIK